MDLYSEQLNLYGKSIKDTFYLNGRKIDEVQLNLYFLDVGVVKTINFDEDLIFNKIKEMDNVFGRNLGELSIDLFKKPGVEQCSKCDYAALCVQ